MQRLISRAQQLLGRVFDNDRPITDEPTRLRKELRLGLIGVLALVVAVIAVGMLYVVPFGKDTYTAELSEAQSVRVGDDVRLAGIPVGSVESLELKPDRVLMRFTVDSDVFVGDQSSLDVRMLTVVGGHYVALFPAGDQPLGDNPIPADRVRLPYSLMETFQDATTPLQEVDGDTLRRNLASLDTSIQGAPDTLRTVLDTLGSYLDHIERQRTQVSNAIAVADEYVTMYDGAKTDLGRLMDNVNLMETVLLDKRAELREAVGLLASVVQRVAAVSPTWDQTLEPKIKQLADALPRLQEYGAQLEPLIGSVQSLGAKLRELAGPGGEVRVDQSGQTITAPGLDLDKVCVPVPGKVC
ncbi:MlaD family protein [Nocardia donostiensis]|uniref:Mammalian cell entry protein n=1 Tax=Nocardia donostiensis TaxID=1538463 RepID=A0A1W0BEU9_9NOCA|nr:MlaD family protein [Nocardia donostiensis]ONM47270.1 mammalian cell entry protein [Nocardia donostiensis]OQS21049.1 mammalian cell entry protein [Nocardia donostiensis]